MFPIAEEMAKRATEGKAKLDHGTRKRDGEVDCQPCTARGYKMIEEVDEKTGKTARMFQWCVICKGTGRAILVASSTGYFGAGEDVIDDFLSDKVDADHDKIFHAGEKRPEGHRYPEPGKKILD
jgi:DnaJ-class molecular chaperone